MSYFRTSKLEGSSKSSPSNLHNLLKSIVIPGDSTDVTSANSDVLSNKAQNRKASSENDECHEDTQHFTQRCHLH